MSSHPATTLPYAHTPPPTVHRPLWSKPPPPSPSSSPRAAHVPPGSQSSPSAVLCIRSCLPESMPCPFSLRTVPLNAESETSHSASLSAAAPPSRGLSRMTGRPSPSPGWREDKGHWRECTWGATERWRLPPSCGTGRGTRRCRSSICWRLIGRNQWGGWRRVSPATTRSSFGGCSTLSESNECLCRLVLCFLREGVLQNNKQNVINKVPYNF